MRIVEYTIKNKVLTKTCGKRLEFFALGLIEVDASDAQLELLPR
jgi:hypothetical protein